MQLIRLLLLVVLLAESAHAQPAATRARLDLRVGSSSGESLELTEVAAMVVGRDGTMFVAQGQDRQVLVIASDGRVLQRLGRRGQGPGEFEGVSRLGLLGDTLWVNDRRQGRFTLFSQAGVLLSTFPTPSHMSGRSPVHASVLLQEGQVLGWGSLSSDDMMRHEDRVVPAMLTTRSGDQWRMLALLPSSPQTLALSRERHGISGLVSSTPLEMALSDSPLLRPSPDGNGALLVVRSAAERDAPASYRLARYDALGNLRWTRDVPYRPRRVSRSEADSLLEPLAATLREGPFARHFPSLTAARRAARDGVRRPAFYPPVNDAVLGRDGTIWVRSNTPPVSGEVPWHVFTADGRPNGAVLLPADRKVLQAEQSTVWGVRRDEDDVPLIERYRY